MDQIKQEVATSFIKLIQNIVPGILYLIAVYDGGSDDDETSIGIYTGTMDKTTHYHLSFIKAKLKNRCPGFQRLLFYCFIKDKEVILDGKVLFQIEVTLTGNFNLIPVNRR